MDTIAAVATGNSVSAIGIIRLSGNSAINAVDRLFKPFGGCSMKDSPERKLQYGKLFTVDGELLDLCLCTVSRAPDSYTGEDTAELQCHGSPVLLREILEEMFKLGVRQAGPGEFTKRAFMNGKMDLTSAEAVIDLIEAESREAAMNAAGQISGAIAEKADEIYLNLADISAHYHAVLDYPDEEIEEFILKKYESVIGNAIVALDRLLGTFERGKLMNQGIPAAIVGRPNAGKSSLLNAMLGYDRAIVTEVPGTTRDTIEEKIRLGNIVLRLTDTAGIRETADPVERIGVERSLSALKSARLVIVVVDGTGPITPEDVELVRRAELAERGIVVLSKRDLADNDARVETVLPVVPVSAVTGEGLNDLEEAVKKAFPLPDVPAGEILTNSRQADAVRTALDYLKSAMEAMNAGLTPDIVLTETEGAMGAIGELTGRSVREDITNRIFSRFCVGK